MSDGIGPVVYAKIYDDVHELMYDYEITSGPDQDDHYHVYMSTGPLRGRYISPKKGFEMFVDALQFLVNHIKDGET